MKEALDSDLENKLTNHGWDAENPASQSEPALATVQSSSVVPLNAVVLQRQEVSPGLIILRIAPDNWEFDEFQPGQFGVLALPASASRCANSDLDEEPIENKVSANTRRNHRGKSTSSDIGEFDTIRPLHFLLTGRNARRVDFFTSRFNKQL